MAKAQKINHSRSRGKVQPWRKVKTLKSVNKPKINGSPQNTEKWESGGNYDIKPKLSLVRIERKKKPKNKNQALGANCYGTDWCAIQGQI